MRFLLVVVVVTALFIASNGDKILSRKRRYLTFPEGSNFVITLSITKGLMWDIPTSGRPPWNSIVEFDALFKLPNTTLRLHERKKAPPQHIYKDVPMKFYYHQHRRDRREVYGQIEELLNIQGMDGPACVQRALCEAKSMLKSGRSFLDDILLVIFSMPHELDGDFNSGEDDHGVEMSTDTCEYWTRSCPISFLQMLLP